MLATSSSGFPSGADAVQALPREGFVAGQVSQVRVITPSLALIMVEPAPQNMLAAKFSIRFAVAAALVLGQTDVGAFYRSRWLTLRSWPWLRR